MLSTRTLAFLAVAAVAIATPLPVAQNSAPLENSNETQVTLDAEFSRDGCEFVANPLLYPVGLRVGFYLQWFATFMANIFVPGMGRQMRTITTLYLLSTFIGLCWAVTNMAVLDGVEVYVLLTLCIGTVPAFIHSPLTEVRVTRTGSLGRLFILMAVFSFGAWFWFDGFNNHNINSACIGDIKFFFNRVPLYSAWFMGLNKALMVIGAITTGGLIGWESFELFRAVGHNGVSKSFLLILLGRMKKEPRLRFLQEKSYENALCAISVFVFLTIIGFIVSVEHAFAYTGAVWSFSLETPTELVPFLISVASLVRVSIAMVSENYRGELRPHFQGVEDVREHKDHSSDYSG